MFSAQLSEPCRAILNTPEMGRLQDVDVYAPARFVHPSMSGSYMEHALGAASVARQIMLSLRESTPALLITDADVECVTVAAMIRHAGALPWSPVLEELLLRNRAGVSVEHRSIRIATSIFARDSVSPVLTHHGVCLARVTEMMVGMCANLPMGVQWMGHDPAYMREIVHAPYWGVDAFTIYRIKLLGRRTELGDIDFAHLLGDVSVEHGHLVMPPQFVQAVWDLDAYCHSVLFTNKLVSVYAMASSAIQKSRFAHSMAHVTLGATHTDSIMMAHPETASFPRSLFAQKVPPFQLHSTSGTYTQLPGGKPYYVVDHHVNGVRAFDTYTPGGTKIH